MEEILRLSNIEFRYEEKYPALRNVSAQIFAGERIAILGGNGAGKSTFFLCLNGVLAPRSGKIYFKGKAAGRSKKELSALRQAVGLVFQEPDSQIIAGTVESEVSFGPMNLRLSAGEVARRVGQSLRDMNLEGYERRAPHYLSGGEKKRVSIADILAMNPEIILFDEPTASLDPENVEDLLRTLDKLNRAGVTIVVSTHDVDFAYRFAERAIVFRQGEIIADGDIDSVFGSESAMREAGLKKPLLYEAAGIIEKRFQVKAGRGRPKTIEEFELFINDAISAQNLERGR